jgi:hypothetical protein
MRDRGGPTEAWVRDLPRHVETVARGRKEAVSELSNHFPSYHTKTNLQANPGPIQLSLVTESSKRENSHKAADRYTA